MWRFQWLSHHIKLVFFKILKKKWVFGSYNTRISDSVRPYLKNLLFCEHIKCQTNYFSCSSNFKRRTLNICTVVTHRSFRVTRQISINTRKNVSSSSQLKEHPKIDYNWQGWRNTSTYTAVFGRLSIIWARVGKLQALSMLEKHNASFLLITGPQ